MLTLARDGVYQLHLSTFILNELYGVLTRKFGWDEERPRHAVLMLGRAATMVEPSISVAVVKRNEADNRILECAVAAGADYLVTGDRRDLLPLGEFDGVKIVTSGAFIEAMFGRREP